MDDCIPTTLHADVREGLMQIIIRIVAWIIFSLSDHSSPTPSLSKLLQALGIAFQLMMLNSKPSLYSFSISTASQSELE